MITKISLREIVSGKSVVVIGNADITTDIREEVQNADIVFRFNHAYNMNELSGTRCTHLVATPCNLFYEKIKSTESGKSLIEQKPVLLTVKFGGERITKELTDLFADCHHIVEADNSFGAMTTGTNFLLALSRCHEVAKSIAVHGFTQGKEAQTYFSTEARHYSGFRNELRLQEKLIAQIENRAVNKEIGNYVLPIVPMHLSSGVKDKNFRNYKGRPLFSYACENAQRILGHCVSITDSLDYCKRLREHGIRAELQENPGFTISDDLRLFLKRENYSGWVMHLQATNPEVNPESLIRYLDLANTLPTNKVAISVVKIRNKVSALFARERHEHEEQMDIVDSKGNKMPDKVSRKSVSYKYVKLAGISPAVPRQRIPETMFFFGGVVLFHTDLLFGTGDIYPKDDNDLVFVEHHFSEAKDIDEEADFWV